jgi:alpha-ketoglutarate-dependent taurine dioxygenase
MIALHLIFAITTGWLFQISTVAAASEQDNFLFQEGGLAADSAPIPFQDKWLRYNADIENVPVPDQLLPPPFVRVYNFLSDGSCLQNANMRNGTETECSCRTTDEENPTTTPSSSISDVSRQAQEIADRELTAHGAILFRGLQLSAADFATFWDSFDWPKFRRIDPFYDRHKKEGIDLAPRAYPGNVIPIHNEQTYNPIYPKKVIFYCLETAAVGGETLLVRNAEITAKLAPWVIDLVKKDGGLLYDHWILYDTEATDDPDKKAKSWQHKTGATNIQDAIRTMVDYGFNETNMHVDDERTIRITNLHPNFFGDETHGDLWLSSVSLPFAKRPNGDRLPHELYQAVELADWQSSYAFMLQKGDLLILDNVRVAHGRLPYENGAGQERQILTTYA